MIRTTKQISMPAFVQSRKSLQRDTGRQMAFELLTAQFKHEAQKVTLSAGVTAGDVSMTVVALTKPIKEGTSILFGLIPVIVAAPVAAGLATIPIVAAPANISNAAVGYADSIQNTQQGFYVPAGTVVDLLSDGRVLPSVIGTSAVTAFGVLETAADEVSKTDAASGYGVIVQGQLYDNLLPDAVGSPKAISGTWKTELLARGGSWMFFQYGDNT